MSAEKSSPWIAPSVSIGLMVGLAFSWWTFSSNLLFVDMGLHDLLSPLDPLVLTGVGILMFIALLFLILEGRWSVLVIIAGWGLYTPSLLYMSGIDWSYAFGLSVDKYAFYTITSPFLIALNGVVLAASTLLWRQGARLERTARQLLEKGATGPEVSTVMNKAWVLNVTLVLVASITTVGVLLLTGAWSDAVGEILPPPEFQGLLFALLAAVMVLFSLWIYARDPEHS
ncbi:MAG TPA: hypothetical protein VMW85_07755 [Methanomassiliicoccales archaeon]|nr:hypothetical protein [Methanomassiliicoccales archaeon]